jgi:cytochrome c oxidase subunit 2
MRSRSGIRRWIGVALLGFIAAVLLSACNNAPSIMEPAGPIAESEKNMAWLVFIIAAIVFVGVTSVLLYSVFRFRARPNSPAPRQVHGNTTIELVWTITPTVILFILLAITISTMFALGQPNDPNTITVRAIGHQWWWEFQYPDPSNPSQMLAVTADEMHMPVNTVVHIDLISDNVIHSLWVPQLGGKTDVIPGHNNTMWLKATQTGNFRGECTEFCGAQHAHMDFVVIAQSSSDYQAWLSAQAASAATPATGSAEANGLNVFKSNGCGGCHTINGVQFAIGKIGPNLTHFGSRMLIAGGVLDNNTTNLSDWILHAQTVKPASDMPSFDGSPGSKGNISQSDLNDLVAYLQSLK